MGIGVAVFGARAPFLNSDWRSDARAFADESDFGAGAVATRGVPTAVSAAVGTVSGRMARAADAEELYFRYYG